MSVDRRLLLCPLGLFLAGIAVSAVTFRFTTLSPEVIQQRLQLVTRKLADRQAALESLFREVGCVGDHFSEQPVPGSRAPNMICSLPGKTEGAILVGGHYDSKEAGMGAVDDWSGSVLLPSLYQSLKSEPRRHRFLFVGFAGEESGLWGSKEYVRRMSPLDADKLRSMINLECLGTGPPRVWARRADPDLLDMYSQVVSMLHTPRDNLAAIHPDDYYTAGKGSAKRTLPHGRGSDWQRKLLKLRHVARMPNRAATVRERPV